MKIIKSASEFIDWRRAVASSVGFTPTMGALHDGHFSLIKSSKKNCSKTVVSIFINPTQFSPNEDLSSYPSTLNADIKTLKKFKTDILFLPTKKEMYEKVSSVQIKPTGLFTKLEGSSRPHFFHGVATIVAKLFNVVQPTHTFFGEKDAQQLRVIKQLINNMNYNIFLISCPTIRNQEGLALSSRNIYLSKKEQQEAANFYKSLLLIKSALDCGETDSKILKDLFKKNINIYKNIKLDYISIALSNGLKEVVKVGSQKILVSSAIYYKNVRLIDNFTYLSST